MHPITHTPYQPSTAVTWLARRHITPPIRKHFTLYWAIFLLLSTIAWSTITPSEAASQVDIGVLAYRGDAEALNRWTQTADYLSQRIPQYRFDIIPLDHAAMQLAMQRSKVDFVLTNPGHYVELEAQYGASRIATLIKQEHGAPMTRYGAVIFTRADRTDLKTLRDLKGKRFMAVSQDAFGGYQMAWRELLRSGVEPQRDLAKLEFSSLPQDEVVYAVRDGRVDAGTVRTGLLETMTLEGAIDLDQFRILSTSDGDSFPFLHSTQLYPEWPFAKLAATSDELAQQVAVALLTMPSDDAAALSGRYAGWTIPLDYQSVHELLKELKVAPYEYLGQVRLGDALRQYWPWLLGALASFLIIAAMLIYAQTLNRRLHIAKLRLENEVGEHEHARAALTSVNARLQHLLTATPAMIYSCAPQRECPTTFISDNVHGQLGYETREFLNDPAFWMSRIHPDDITHVISSMDVILSHGQNLREYRFRNSSGQYRWLLDEVRLVRGDDGRPLEVVGYLIDVTERKRAEELAMQHQSELAHCLRLTTMGEMATMLAHDINQPLTAISGYAQGCTRRLNNDEYDILGLRRALEEITHQADRAAAVVRQVRAYVGKEKTYHARFNINDLVVDAIRLLEPEARRNEVIIEQELAPVPLYSLGNATQIEQVILNLGRNGIEAMFDTPREQRVLRFVTKREGDNIQSCIFDRGSGVAAGEFDNIFQAFHTTKPGGMGMGLSISRSIIESHHGQLWAAPISGSGMLFCFKLPAAEAKT